MSEEDRSKEVPQIPELAEDYQLVRELGRGGTAVVYLARDRELGRDVAIKLIRPAYLHDEDAIARLLREARTVGKLQHPAIVMLLGTRRLGDYGLALILQYVHGSTLKQRIQERGQLSIQDTERVLRDVGTALQYAHAQRIVHRDIKPENIYLDEACGLARLADFGLARTWDSDSGLTLPGTALGTPAYMSPEQVDGKELDGRSDLFSLGLVGYEMLTGRQPWAGESLYSVIYKQKHEDLPSIRLFRPDAPENLVRAIEGAIRKAPDDRWASAADFLKALAQGSDLPPLPAVAEPGPPMPQVRESTPAPVPAESALDVVEAALAARGSAAPPPAVGPPQGAAPPSSWPTAAGQKPPARPKPKRKGRRVAIGALLALVVAALVVYGLGRNASPTSMLGRVATAMAGAAESVFGGASSGSAEIPGGGAVAGGGPGGASDVGSFGASGSTDDLPRGSTIPAEIQILGGDHQGGAPGATLPLPLVVRVINERGEGIAGVAVAFDVAAGGGVSTPRRDVTGADGTVIARWTLGLSGEDQILIARAEGLEDRGATFMASVTSTDAAVAAADPAPVERDEPAGGGASPVASRAEVVGGGGQQGAAGRALPDGLVLRVLNDAGAPVPGVDVRFQVTSGGGVVSPGTVTTDAGGVARTSWTLGSAAGSQSVAAMVEGARNVRATFEATALSSSLSTAPTVVVGGTHSCSLRGDGTMVCWGGNGRGQLGDGSSSGRLVPSLSVQGGTFARVASGLGHVCALNGTGEAFCWGSNDQGQLGTGGSASSTLPTRVSGTVRFTQITAGVTHTCGLGTDGSIYCWGGNDSGQLGDGSGNSHNTPTRVDSGATFTQVAAGWRHTCALDGEGRAYCWGSNDSGQLGVSGGNARAPAPVGGTFRFRQLAAGNAHTCGITTDGRIACWGANDSGQLGDGTNQSRPAPAPVATTASFSAVTAGGVHTCALTTDGSAMCWGANVYGQLGDGTTESRNVPIPVSGFDRFTQVDAFGSHNCARTPSGDVLCWGYNVEGQIGDGTRENQLVPTPVTSARP